MASKNITIADNMGRRMMEEPRQVTTPSPRTSACNKPKKDGLEMIVVSGVDKKHKQRGRCEGYQNDSVRLTVQKSQCAIQVRCKRPAGQSLDATICFLTILANLQPGLWTITVKVVQLLRIDGASTFTTR
jgi:hypothetical protein